MFGIIPKPLWEKEVPADCHNRIKMVTRSLLLVSADKKIIIDTGNGEKWQKKFRDIYDIDTKTVSLNSSLSIMAIHLRKSRMYFVHTFILIMLEVTLV